MNDLEKLEENGYPEINPFLEGYKQTFTVFYTPNVGLSVNPKTEEAIHANDANEFYNAVREKDGAPWTCDTIDEAMFDVLNEKYGIDFSGGFADQLQDHVKTKNTLSA